VGVDGRCLPVLRRGGGANQVDIASWPAGRTQEKYCIEPGTYSGIILLYSIVNGEPLALLQDGYLQHVRVGAAAGIGVDLMALPEADTLGLIGSGAMARTYLEAIAEVRSLRQVRVYSTSPPTASVSPRLLGRNSDWTSAPSPRRSKR
jgi:hypothetical protein